MIATENADKVGEFSLTDRRFSRITQVHGGDALRRERGRSLRQHAHRPRQLLPGLLRRRPRQGRAEEWQRLGFNSSSVHTDIVSTTDRVVTAQLRGGEERVIYRNGEFQLEQP